MDMHRFARGLLLTASLFLGVTALQAAPKPFVLAANGRAEAVVVAYGGDTNGIGYAAAELAAYLGRISGAQFMVASKPVPGYRTLLVGAPYKASRQEELSVRVVNENEMQFTGDGPRGTLYAVYEFLEYLGVLFSANDYEYIPSLRSLAVPGDYARVDAPFMTYRDGWGAITFDTPYSLKLRMQGGSSKPWLLKWFGGATADIAQTLTGKWLSPRKYFKDHPEWYAIIPGGKNERGGLWPCVSNNQMYEQLFREIEAELKARPEIREISLGMTDTPYFCDCPECRKLAEKYPDPDGAETVDVQMIEVCNRVGRHFAKSHPGIRFNFLNYGGRFPGNENMTIEPNVGGCAAELWRNHALSADNNERSSFALQRLAKYSHKTPGMGPYIWEYYCNFASYLIPFPNLYTYGQTARYYKDLNVSGCGAQMQLCIDGDMASLHFWLYAKLLWNPDADEKELVRTYIGKTYGAAAPFIQEYVDLLEYARLRQRFTWYGAYVDSTEHYLTTEDCFRINDLFQKAQHAVGGDPDRRLLVKRAKLAAVTMTMFRRYDMLDPAILRNRRLPSREQLITEFHEIRNDTSNTRFGPRDHCENGSADANGFRRTFANPDVPTIWTNRLASIAIPPARMDGGKKMTMQKDPDGTEYRQLKVKLAGEPEGIWMNPSYAEIGYTVKTNTNPALNETGEWYVFADVRLGATVEDDKAAAYFGHYQPWIVNGVVLRGLMETADMPVPGHKDDRDWQTLCLGKRRLVEKSRIWVMPGILHPTDFADVRSFTFIAPRILENPRAATPKDAPARVIEAKAFDKGEGVQVLRDIIDRFDYARITNVTDSIEYTIRKEDAGEWHVLLNIRSGASVVLDSHAATASIQTQSICTECGERQVPVRRPVSGSLGDEAWQVVSLGVQKLEPGMKIRLEPGTNNVPHFTDLRRINLVSPDYFRKSLTW
jgi:hypothetical protein